MLAVTAALVERGLGNDINLVTDSRATAWHGQPYRAGNYACGRPIALLHDGDRIVIDAVRRVINRCDLDARHLQNSGSAGTEEGPARAGEVRRSWSVRRKP